LLIGDNINQKSFNMMKFLRLLICVCILLIADQTVYSAQEKWIFINQDQGVTMHSRKVAGRAESEFRGSSTIDQPVEVVGAVLADIPSFTRWFYKCIQARKIPDKTSTDLNFLIYIVIETPWPLWNRDVVYAATTTIDIVSGNIIIQGHARQDAADPIRKDHVRITDSELQWTLERLDSNQTMVTFTKRINAGGNLGSYLSDAGCKKTVFSSLVNMRDVAADPKYATLGEQLKREYGRD
jgi:hypothetical protein